MSAEIKPAPVWATLAAGVTKRMPLARHSLIEGLFGGLKQRFVARMATQLGGYSFDCCLRDRVARKVFFAGCHATQEIAFVRDVLRPGMTFLDVGANWGLFTLVAAHLVGPTGQVVALEPDPRIFAKLKWNMERNELVHVRIFDVAAADRDTHLILAAHDDTSENWEVSMLVESVAQGQPKFEVQARRVDGLLDEAGLTTIDLLKMDVEGAEDMALTGMEAGLRSQRYRRMLIELHPVQLGKRNRTARDVVDMLQAHGYKGYALDETPPAMRKAYYHPWLPSADFILPLEQGLAGGLRHTIWMCPDEPDLA